MLYSNRKCNEFDRFQQHKLHLERIVSTKPAVKLETPKKPGFLFRKTIGKHHQNEKNIKIDYENALIMKKIIHLETHNTQYHPQKIMVKDCPAFDKRVLSDHPKNLIQRENYVRSF